MPVMRTEHPTGIHPLHVANRRTPIRSLFGPLVAGVAVGIFAVGGYALLVDTGTAVDEPAPATGPAVSAPRDPNLTDDADELIACMENEIDAHAAETGKQSPDLSTVARAQGRCAAALRDRP